MKTINIILLSLIVLSCNPYRYIDKHKAEVCATCIEKDFAFQVDTVEKIVIKTDTSYIIYGNPDTIYSQIYMECDTNRKIVITNLDEIKKSKKIAQFYKLKNNKLSIITIDLQDSIMKLNSIIEKSKDRVVEKIVKEPFLNKWIYIIIILIILAFIAIIISK